MNFCLIVILCVYVVQTTGSKLVTSLQHYKLKQAQPLNFTYENTTLGTTYNLALESELHNDADTQQKQNEIASKDVAVILLVNRPRELSRILKENPYNRNEEIMKLLLNSATNATIKSITAFLSARENKIITNELPEEGRISFENKIEKLLVNPSLIRKLNNITLYLCDFLSLDSYEKISDVYNKFPTSIENEIKRLLYLNPEKLVELNDIYYQENSLNCNRNYNITLTSTQLYRKCIETNFEESLLSRKNESIIDAPTYPTRNRATKDKEIKLGDISETSSKGLQFPDAPSGGDMRIHNLKMEEKNLLFSAFSVLMAYLQPGEFPLGLIKDAFQNSIPLHVLIFQVMKLEGIAFCWILLWAILSLCLPFAVVAQMCRPKRNIQRLHSDSSSSSSNLNNKCTGRAMGFILYVLLLLLLGGILLLLVTNDKFSRATEKLPSTANVVFKDIETFIKNFQAQISFVATSSFDITMNEMNRDLKDVRKLLGNSIKDDINRHTNLNETISALIQLKYDGAKMARRVRELLRECSSVENTAKDLRENLVDVLKQLNIARINCTQRDRKFCESLKTNGLDVMFSAEELISDRTLQYLDRLGQDHDFNRSIDETVRMFDDIPKYVTLDTSSQRTEIGDVLYRRRKRMFNSLRSFEELSGSIIISLRTTLEKISDLLENIASGDSWRYLSVVGTSFMVFLIWILIICGSPCGCHYTNKIVPYLIISIVLMCKMSLVLWFLGSISFLIGGHGQTIVCNTLYDEHFDVLSRILDEENFLYDRGFFSSILEGNESIRTEDVLRNCEHNQTTYVTFHLNNNIDINKLTNYKNWDDLRAAFDKFSININNMKILSDNLERYLQKYPSTSNIDFKKLRSRIYQPVTSEDLNKLFIRIQSVSKKITDENLLMAFEQIILKLNEIINTKVRTVENHRDSILYKLTALEILMSPLETEIESLLSKLQAARIFIKNGGKFLTEKNVRNYLFRFEKNLNDMHEYTDDQVKTKLGGCKPIWDLFYYTRHHICKLIIDPMNGISFACYMILILFFAITPIVINVIKHFRELKELSSDSITHRQTNEGMIINDQGVWITPEERSPVDGNNKRRKSSSSEEIILETPSRRPIDVIPTPPRLPSEPIFYALRLSSGGLSEASSSK